MTVTDSKNPKMSAITNAQTGWTDEKRHCLHILATHYPVSSWIERVAIFNQVCNDKRTANQIRDEYGGHSAGQRDRSGGRKPSRSIRWNDIVCRDEFGLPGPFTHQQQADRGTILHGIQNAINTLSLSGSAALAAVNLVPGMAMADVNLAPGNAAAPGSAVFVPPVPAPLAALAGIVTTAPSAQPGTSSAITAAPTTAAVSTLAGPSTTTPNLQFGTTTASSSVPFQLGATASNSRVGTDIHGDEYLLRRGEEHFPAAAILANDMCDPEEGNAEWYHSCEIKWEGRDGTWVFRAIKDLPYDDEIPAETHRRWVHFPAMGFQQFPVLVCFREECEVCGDLQSVELGEREERDD